MPWFKVDDGFASSRQILSIPPRHRTKAAGLWVLAGAWSAKELTDGYVPEYVLRDLCATPATAAHLVAAGLWEKTEGGWNFVGWSKFQFTKSRVMEHRQNEVERKRRARERSEQIKAQRAGQQNVDNVRSLSAPDTGRNPAGIRVTSALPDQTRPDPLPITTYLGGEVTSVGARCPRHIDDPDPPPCGACADARRANDTAKQTAQLQRQAQLAANRAAIDACTHCDDHGLFEIADNQMARCPHPAVLHA
jgi:hypothetical protein